MAHERSISVGKPPNVFLIPTVIDGTRIDPADAVRLFETGELEALGGPFKTIKEADKASKKRSREFVDPAKKLFPNMPGDK